MSSRSTIEKLKGEAINGVCFVMDYLELRFNGPILRCLSNPTLEQGARVITFPEAGSRDAFCSLIGSTVKAIDVKDDRFIRLYLSSNATVTIPLDRLSRTGPEAAHFVPGLNEPIDVW